MGKDETNIAAAGKRAAIEQADYSAYRIKRKLDDSFWHKRDEVGTSLGHSRMDKDDRLPTVEFVEHWLECVIPGPRVVVPRHQAEAIRLQRIQSVFDFAEAAVDIRKRQRCEHA